MILHLFDDEKVVSRTIENFESVIPGENIFVCLCRKKRRNVYEPKHIKTKFQVFYFDNKCDSFSLDLCKCKLVIIHYLTIEKIEFVNKYINQGTRICWSIWGGDFYEYLERKSHYELYSYDNPYKRRRFTFKCLLKYVMGIEYYRGKIIDKFIRERVNEIIGTHENLIELEHITKKSFVNHKFYYYQLEQILGNLITEYVDYRNKIILCGNSASFSGNHSYVLEILSKAGISGFDIVMPLSYGGNERYIGGVIKKGKELFKEHYNPITEFLPLSKYNNLMIKSSVCLYGNWREEAFGNIVIALYLGAKVFLSYKNPYLKGLTDLGFVVYKLEDISVKDINTPMHLEDIKRNRSLCMELFSYKKIPEYINNIVNG